MWGSKNTPGCNIKTWLHWCWTNIALTRHSNNINWTEASEVRDTIKPAGNLWLSRDPNTCQLMDDWHWSDIWGYSNIQIISSLCVCECVWVTNTKVSTPLQFPVFSNSSLKNYDILLLIPVTLLYGKTGPGTVLSSYLSAVTEANPKLAVVLLFLWVLNRKDVTCCVCVCVCL